MARLDAHRGAEIIESEATGKVKYTYDDIRASLRLPYLSLVFRMLAGQPEFLEQAWLQLRPNVVTVYFERQADRIRVRAVDGVAKLGAPPRAPAGAAEVLRVFHYGNPKLLLVVAALRAATQGQHPVLQMLSPDSKRQIVTGVPPDAPEIAEVAQGASDDRTAEIYADIISVTGLPAVPVEYRALASWPDYFAWSWQSTRSLAGSQAYVDLERALRRLADETLGALPFRMDLSPHTLRLCGLLEQDIDQVSRTLDTFYRALPGLVANTAFLATGLEGQFGASRSPFPARTT